jgi:rubrerythrin
LIAKGELTSLEALIGVQSKKKKKKKKPEKDEEDLTPEQLKLRNIKQTVDEAISGVLDRLEEMVAELNNAASLEETIEIAKRIRSAKHILFTSAEALDQHGMPLPSTFIVECQFVLLVALC